MSPWPPPRPCEAPLALRAYGTRNQPKLLRDRADIQPGWSTSTVCLPLGTPDHRPWFTTPKWARFGGGGLFPSGCDLQLKVGFLLESPRRGSQPQARR